jgi:class 3 adenylate cyclase
MPVVFFTDIEGSTRLWEEHTSEMGAVTASSSMTAAPSNRAGRCITAVGMAYWTG